MSRVTASTCLVDLHSAPLMADQSTAFLLDRYDDLKSAQENIDLQSTILSRFDLIFIVKDERTVDRDKMIAR